MNQSSHIALIYLQLLVIIVGVCSVSLKTIFNELERYGRLVNVVTVEVNGTPIVSISLSTMTKQR